MVLKLRSNQPSRVYHNRTIARPSSRLRCERIRAGERLGGLRDCLLRHVKNFRIHRNDLASMATRQDSVSGRSRSAGHHGSVLENRVAAGRGGPGESNGRTLPSESLPILSTRSRRCLAILAFLLSSFRQTRSNGKSSVYRSLTSTLAGSWFRRGRQSIRPLLQKRRAHSASLGRSLRHAAAKARAMEVGFLQAILRHRAFDSSTRKCDQGVCSAKFHTRKPQSQRSRAAARSSHPNRTAVSSAITTTADQSVDVSAAREPPQPAHSAQSCCGETTSSR